jgi:tetratricopeptide (TPR) repeat protein
MKTSKTTYPRPLRAWVLGFALILFPCSANAADDSNDDTAAKPNPVQTQYNAAKRAIKQGRFAVAIPILQKVVKAEPRNAGAYNYLGYAHRKLGKLDASYDFYQKALKLDPKHRGAHEYLGELYLQRGDLASAEAMLKKLNSLCFFGCEELDDLKKAIAQYKAGKKKGA